LIRFSINLRLNAQTPVLTPAIKPRKTNPTPPNRLLKIMFFILVFTFSPRTINYNVCDLSPGLSQGGPPLAAPAPGPLYFWKIRKMVPLVVPTPGPPLTELMDLAVWGLERRGFCRPHPSRSAYLAEQEFAGYRTLIVVRLQPARSLLGRVTSAGLERYGCSR